MQTWPEYCIIGEVKKEITALALILLLALGLRFWQLGQVPPGFHRDEAFLGYNGFSILKTGRDINGHLLPLHLQSFLYSPAGYSYFTIPFIKLFGLTPLAVRLPAAFFGVLTVLAIYFLVRGFSDFSDPGSERTYDPGSFFGDLPLIASLLLAVNPWHINLSRTATENVIVVFFLVWGIWLYLLWVKKGGWFWLAAAFICFGLTLTLYQAARAFLPLFLPILIISKNKTAKANCLFAWGLFWLIIILPLLIVFFSSTLSLRLRTVSLLATPETQLVINQQLREDGVAAVPLFFTRLFHNKPMSYFSQFLDNYFSHFSFRFLFTDQGLPDRYRVPLSGLLYFFDLPLLLLGGWYLLRREGRERFILAAWLLLAFIGSALAFDDIPNLQRTLIALPIFSTMISLGLWQLICRRKRQKILSFLLAGWMMFGIYNFAFYLHQYYIHFPRYRPWYRQDGYQELVKEVNQLLPSYQKAMITNRESAPTIFFLFFSQYDPAQFQQETQNPAITDFDRISFGKYQFLPEECPLRLVTDEDGHSYVNGEKGVLYVNSGLCDKPIPDSRQLAEIRRLDNSLAFRILEYQP